MQIARPEQPQNVRSASTTSRSINLVWEEPHDNNSPIMGYRVMYRNPDFLDTNRDLQVVNTTIEMAIITGLHPGVTYNFTIVAFNDIGDSTPSITAPITTLDEGTLLCITVMDLLASNLQKWLIIIDPINAWKTLIVFASSSFGLSTEPQCSHCVIY